MSFIMAVEMAAIRHFAANGDKMADALVKVYDALRADGKEVVVAQAASTVNIASLSGLSAVDGYTPSAGDTILVKNQSTTSQNGLYEASAGAWTIITNFNGDPNFELGTAVFVVNGTAGSGTLWTCTTFTGVGNATAFTQFSAGTVTAGSITASKLDIATVGSKIMGAATFSVAGESSGHIDTTIQCKDIQGNNLAAAAMITVWVSDAAGGGATTQSTLTTSVQTGTILDTLTANKLLMVITNATGQAIVRIADTGKSYYLNTLTADGIVSSAVITLT